MNYLAEEQLRQQHAEKQAWIKWATRKSPDKCWFTENSCHSLCVCVCVWVKYSSKTAKLVH